MTALIALCSVEPHVPETAFGKWFLQASTLTIHLLDRVLTDMEKAIREFFRVLKPGGVSLFAKSTRRYIHSWIIRLLFRHPMDVQKAAPEYLASVHRTGFAVSPESVPYPYLWWSCEDLGVMERWPRLKPPVEREKILLNLVVSKPYA